MKDKQEILKCYEKWKTVVDSMPPYSKSTAYTNLPEFEDIVKLGSDALPILLQKLVNNRGLDYILADAVIRIKGWKPHEFSQTDLEERRTSVIRKLKKEYQ